MSRASRIAAPAVVLVVAFIGTAAQRSHGQVVRTATIAGWLDDSRQFVRERRDAWGGLFHDRGLFRRLTPQMDTEYDTDFFVYRFSPFDDSDFYGRDVAFRTYMGSINTTRLILNSQARLNFDRGPGIDSRLPPGSSRTSGRSVCTSRSATCI